MSGPPYLSSKHRTTVEIESGIAPDLLQGGSVRTISRGRDLPKGFSARQRKRAPGVLFTVPRPNGEAGYSFRPDEPDPARPGCKYEQACKALGGPGNFLGVYETSPGLLSNNAVPVMFTEGAKKALSLVSAAKAAGSDLVVVAISGVWNWLSDGAPIPDMLAIPVKGRRAQVCFDSDILSNPQVQDAARRLAEHLVSLKANVWITYLPDQPDGSKTGADDFLAAGDTLKELELLTRPYDPADFSKIRLSRDEKLAAALGDLERRWWAEEWQGMGGHTDRDVALKLIEAARRYGKPVPDGVRVVRSWGTLGLESKVTPRTLSKAINRLEGRGFLYRDNEGRKADKAGAFVLRASVKQGGTENGRKEKETQVLQESNHPTIHLRAPRLLWSRPKFTPRIGLVTGTTKVRQGARSEPRDRIERLGKVRGAILDALDAAGGSATLPEIAEVLHRKRPRDIRRRNLPALEDAGIVTVEGDIVSLADDWLEALDNQRRLGKEIDQRVTVTFGDGSEEGFVEEGEETLARRRMELKRQEYHGRGKASKARPSAVGLAAVKRSEEKRGENIAEHEEHQAKARAAELEAKRFAKRFVYERVQELGRVRLGLLQEILRDAGGAPAYALPAAKSLGCVVERLAEYGNEEFVLAPASWGKVGEPHDEPLGLLDECEGAA